MHNALLVHDDIEDASDERRGTPTLHALHGVPLAINAGDAMGLLSLRPLKDNLHRLGLATALRIFEETERMAWETTEGQALELGWQRDNRTDVTDEDYLHMVLQKTCWLAAIHPLRVGCLIGARGRLPLDPLIRLGFFFGAAFQIQDDLLNLEAGPAYGKEINGDLLEGKRTLMIIHALRHARQRERRAPAGFLGAAARRAHASGRRVGPRACSSAPARWSMRARWRTASRARRCSSSTTTSRGIRQPGPALHARPDDLGDAARALSRRRHRMSHTILLYGATGYSGRLIAAEAERWRDRTAPALPSMILAGPRRPNACGAGAASSTWTTASSGSTIERRDRRALRGHRRRDQRRRPVRLDGRAPRQAAHRTRAATTSTSTAKPTSTRGSTIRAAAPAAAMSRWSAAPVSGPPLPTCCSTARCDDLDRNGRRDGELGASGSRVADQDVLARQRRPRCGARCAKQVTVVRMGETPDGHGGTRHGLILWQEPVGKPGTCIRFRTKEIWTGANHHICTSLVDTLTAWLTVMRHELAVGTIESYPCGDGSRPPLRLPDRFHACAHRCQPALRALAQQPISLLAERAPRKRNATQRAARNHAGHRGCLPPPDSQLALENTECLPVHSPACRRSSGPCRNLRADRLEHSGRSADRVEARFRRNSCARHRGAPFPRLLEGRSTWHASGWEPSRSAARGPHGFAR